MPQNNCHSVCGRHEKSSHGGITFLSDHRAKVSFPSPASQTLQSRAPPLLTHLQHVTSSPSPQIPLVRQRLTAQGLIPGKAHAALRAGGSDRRPENCSGRQGRSRSSSQPCPLQKGGRTGRGSLGLEPWGGSGETTAQQDTHPYSNALGCEPWEWNVMGVHGAGIALGARWDCAGMQAQHLTGASSLSDGWCLSSAGWSHLHPSPGEKGWGVGGGEKNPSQATS